MVADGNDGTEGANGKDGKDVYITYHDSEEEPARPNGNGTTGDGIPMRRLLLFGFLKR